MPEIGQVARELRADLKQAEAESVAAWAVATARRNRETLATGVRPDGERLAPNRPGTLKRKKRHGQDPRPGVQTGELLRGLDSRAAMHPLDNSSAEVYGSGGAGLSDMKANILIKGDGKRQVARDYMSHDEAVVEQAAEQAAEWVLRAWGF